MTTWTTAALAQQEHQLRTVGILMGATDHGEARRRLDGFLDAFRQIGWIDGQNIRLDIRWGGADPQVLAAQARELVRLKPDVILVGPTNAVLPLLKETRTIPIVFVSVSDPVEQGIVGSIARPTGNVTGFSNLDRSIMGKWVQILKEAAPSVKRAGLMIATTNAASPGWYRMFEQVAPTLSVEPISLPVRDQSEIEGAIRKVAGAPDGGLITPGDTYLSDPSIRQVIINLAARHRLPAVYGELAFAPAGGLISYGIDRVNPFRRAASYIDRILKGEKPSELPVQQPTKFHFTVNLNTAKALGLDLSPTFVATADEIIE